MKTNIIFRVEQEWLEKLEESNIKRGDEIAQLLIARRELEQKVFSLERLLRLYMP